MTDQLNCYVCKKELQFEYEKFVGLCLGCSYKVETKMEAWKSK